MDVRPIQGTFNIAGARIIAPGDPSRSVLYYRVSKLGGGRMPRVGSNQVDERAVRMIHDWIAGMPATEKPAAGADTRPIAAEDRAAPETLAGDGRRARGARPAAIRRLASSTRGALMLLGLIDRGAGGGAHCAARSSRSRGHSPSIEVRDLFERFIPEGERIKRLGDVVDRRAILALRGDAARGRAVFADEPRGPVQDLPQGRRRSARPSGRT